MAEGDVPDITPEFIEFWRQIIRISQRGLYWQAGATALVLYDHFTTFDLEVELIWKRKWSFVKICWILNRYIGDVLFLHGSAFQIWVTGTLFEKTCPSAIQLQAWLGMVVLWTMNAIIINRIACMYNFDRKVLCILLVGFFIHVVAGTIVTGMAINRPSFVVPLTSYAQYCSPNPQLPIWFWSYFFFTAAFELLVFILSLIQGIRYHRETRALNSSRWTFIGTCSHWTTQSHLLSVLIRDSILFPFVGLTLGLFNILAYFGKLPFGSSQIITILAAASSPILGCRLLLNLRDAYYASFRQEFNQSLFNRSVFIRSLEPDIDMQLPATPKQHSPAS